MMTASAAAYRATCGIRLLACAATQVSNLTVILRTSASTSMEFSIFYGNFSIKWKFLWNRDKCGNSMENWK